MMTGIKNNKGKGTGFALKRLVASLLVLIQCASLTFVGVPVAYAEEDLPPQDAVETVIAETEQEPVPAQQPADVPEPAAPSSPAPDPEEQPAVSAGGVLEADLGGLQVSVSFAADAEIPDGAFLSVRVPQLPPMDAADAVPGALYLSETEQAVYKTRMLQALSLTDYDAVFAQQYLALAILDAEGKPVTPASPLSVCIRFPLASPAEAETWAAVSFDETGAFGTAETTTVLAAASSMEYEGCTLRFVLSDLPLIGLCSSARQLLFLQSGYMNFAVYGPAGTSLVYDSLQFIPEPGSLLLEAYSLLASSPAPNGATALWVQVSAHGAADGQRLWLCSLNGTTPAALLSETGSTSGLVYLDGATGLALFTPNLNAPLYADDTVTLEGAVPAEVTVTVEDVSAAYADYDLSALVLSEPEQGQYPMLFAGWRKAFQMLTSSVPEQTAQSAAPRYELIGAYDITLWLANETYQPEPGYPVRVSITEPAIASANNLQLWHLHDDGSRERIYDFIVEGSTLSFDASGFSVYLVIGEDAVPRCTYTFFAWNEEDRLYKAIPFTDDTGTTVYSQTVKSGEMPVIPQLPASENKEFKGWYKGTIEGGTEPVLEENSYDFSQPVSEDTDIYLYAVFTEYVDVLFHGQYDRNSGTFPVAFTRRGELVNGSATVTISDLSVTYSADDLGEDMAFCGWSFTPISTPGAAWDDAENPVAPISGDSITVTENTSLYPVFQRIRWLTFYAAQSGSGASYNAPRYYFVDQAEAGPLPISQRDGYAFLGWYTGTLSTETVEGEQIETVTYGTRITDENGSIVSGSIYDAGIELSDGVMYLRGNATLYAKWEAQPAEYRIVIQKQRASDAADLPDAEKSYEYMESAKLSAPVGTSVSVPEEYTQRSYPGYSYARSDAAAVVAADGSTVLNVYYDKNSDYTPTGTYTLRFADPFRADPIAEHTEIAYGLALSSYKPEDPESARPGYEFTRWYLDADCTVPAELDTLTMPDHDLTLYAGWDLIWYLVKIDPNYGSLATLDGTGNPVGSGSTWFWKTVEDEPIGEYTYVTRDYEESSSGEYFYVLHDRDYYGYSDTYESAESGDRYSYYVKDPGQATEDRTFEYVPGIYSYAGWYEVHEDGSETPYQFGSPVDHNTTLRLHWKKNGIYFITYSASNISGTVSGLFENNKAVEEIDIPYEDNAGIELDRVPIAPPGYTFVGWQVRGDESGQIYTPGQTFTLHADDAVRIGGKEVVYLHAVYVQLGTARIVYDFNGGTLSGDFDFGSPTQPGATSIAADGSSAEVFNIVNNSEFTLSSGENLTRGEAAFKGWRDPVSGTLYAPGLKVGVDTAEPVTLVAAWEVKVRYYLNSTDAAWGSGWSDYSDEADGSKSMPVFVGDTVSEPGAIPAYNGTDGRMFRFWTTEPDGTTAYDFSAPVSDELKLYACWSDAIEVPVHAVDASAETLAEQPGWVPANAAILIGRDAVTLDAATAAMYVTPPSGDYTFAFAAALNQAPSRDNVSEADAVTTVYYNQDAKHLYVRFADTGREDEILTEDSEIFFFYYKKQELTVTYKSMLSSGELLDAAVSGAPSTTEALLGLYNMASHITQPLGWVSDSTLTNYAFAIGSADVTNASGLSLITATSSSDSSRPPLLVENTWNGFHYSEDNGGSWVSCGFDPTLYVVYFAQQPTVLMFHESTVGTSEILHTEFVFDLLVTETQTVTVSVQRQQLVDGNWVDVGEPTETESSSTTSQIFDTRAEGNQPYRLKDGEANSAVLFYRSSTSETPGTPSTEGEVTVRDLTVTTTVVSQTAEITQTADPAFSTAIDGRLQTEEPYTYTYTSDGSGGTRSVTFTNTHKAADVEIHVAQAETQGLVRRDASRSATEAYYSFQLPMGGTMKLPDSLSAERLFIGDSDVYAFGAVFAGKGEEGSHITDVRMGIASVTYGQIEGNVYGLILKDSSGQTLGTLDGEEQLYYLYYPMPRIEYVKLGDGGSLTPIGQQEEGDPVITYNGSPLTMNGQTVAQGQRIEISLGDFVISQSGNSFRMPPVLDDGEFRRYLGYTSISAGEQGVRTIDGLSAEPSPDLTMHLHLRENELGSMSLQFSFDGDAWVDLPLTGSPTVYAIYTERGYDLLLSKSLVIPDDEKDNPIFAGRTFTVTITSDAIKRAEYDAEGADSAVISATPATASAPGSIVLKVEDGTRIRIKGLGRGEYTITETENTNFVLTARRGSITAQTPPYTTVENNSTVTLGESSPFDSDTQVILINTPQELCQIVDDGGTAHIFYTLRSAVRYIEENIANYTATIEMLTESYVIPAGDSVEIPSGFNVTLTTADSMSNVATITRGADLTGQPVFTNNGSLTISQLYLDGAGLESSAPMIQSGGPQLTLGASSSIKNVLNSGNGGAINATAGDVTLSGTEISNNEAVNGAAVYYTGSGTITVTGSETELLNNTASANGGAIYAAQGKIVLSEGASVSGNEASGLGGAIYAGNASITVEDEGTRLSENTAASGGAIYAVSSAIAVSGGTITGNEASQGNGGAISVGSGSVTVSGGSMTGNTAAGKGGAIYTENADVSLGGTAALKTNTAKEGGAVYSDRGAVTISGGTVQNNSASEGSGGAVYAGSGNVTVSGGSLTENTASGSGGAVYAGSGNVTVSGGSMTGNTASGNGGAVSADSGTLTVSGTTTFTDNEATGKGGAFYVGSGLVNMTDAVIDSNKAGAEGGALYAGEGAVTLTNVTATGNIAGSSGGAVYAGSGNMTVSGGSMARNTSTAGSGGALYAGGPLTVSNASLTDNKAASGKGGAVYAGGITATLNSVTASGNSAENGAAVFDNNGRATFNDGSYTGNTATAGGAIGVGSTDARLVFNGSVQVKDNLMNGDKSNVYLDQDDDAVIIIDNLGANAAIGIHVPDPVVPTRSVPGARFANYFSNANVNKITNDRYPALTVQSDTASKKLYWGSSIRVEVRYLASYRDGLPFGNSIGEYKKVIDNYYPTLGESGDVSLSELASDVKNKNALNLTSTAVYGGAFAYNSTSYGNDVTRLIWNTEAEKWQIAMRNGQTEDLNGRRIYIVYTEPAYIAIENNTETELTVSDLLMTVGGSDVSVINSEETDGYGMVFAKNGAIRKALLPIQASDLILAAGASINLLIPGGRDMSYKLEGSFADTALGGVRLRRGTEGDYVEETLPLTGGIFETLTGRTLNGSGTYQIIFGDDKPICKVKDVSGVEHPYSKISDALAAIKNGTITLATPKTAVIEMLVDYLLPASDYVLIPRGYDITLTTATDGTYPYTGEGDRAIISRDSENTDSMIDAWNGLTGQDTINALDNTTLRITNLVFDGKSVQGSSDGGAVKSKYVNVYVDSVDFKNVYAANGGAMLIMFSAKDKNKKKTVPGTVMEVTNSTFTGCTSTTTETSNRLGGGAIVTNAETMTLDNCVFDTCTAVDQAGAVFHRVDDNYDSWANISGCTFTNCSANAAGGLELDSKTITVSDCVFEHCVASQRNGGGFNVYALNTATPTTDCWVTVSGCTFNDCQLTTTNTSNGNGGGFRSNAVYTKVENSTFTNNQAIYGGGFCISNANAKKGEVYGCTFERNTANGYGGGIYGKPKELIIGGYPPPDESGVEPTVPSLISNCTSSNDGGGVYHTRDADGTKFTVTDAVITDNRTKNNGKNGGGIWTNAREVDINGSTISDNTSTSKGGGLYAYSYTCLTITDSDISRNTASAEGGGVWFDANSDTNRNKQILTVKGSTIDGNSSGASGGGIYTLAKTVTISGSETKTDKNGKPLPSSISNNTAKTNGGGVYQNRSVDGSVLQISDAVINGNTANNTNTGTDQGGGGIFAGVRTLTLTNSTVSNNTAKSHGGGILFEINNDNARNVMSLTAEGCTLDGNSAAGNGGGIYTRAKTVEIKAAIEGEDDGAQKTPTVISNCTAGYSGGGIYQNRNVEGSALTVTDSRISGCTANETNTDQNPPRGGGGIFAYVWTTTVKDSEISGNRAVRNGGGISSLSSDTNRYLIIDNSRIEGNSADYRGGGIYTRSQLNLQNGSSVTGNRLNSNTAEDAAGVYVENNRTVTVGVEGLEKDTLYINGNTASSGEQSNLRLWDLNSSNNHQKSVYVNCSLGGEILVVNAKQVGTVFGHAADRDFTGLIEEDHVFKSDHSTLYGIYNRSDGGTDPLGAQIIWAGPPIAKITGKDSSGKDIQLYLGVNNPAIFDRLYSGGEGAENVLGAFNLFNYDEPPLYTADGKPYTGKEYSVKMLVERFETNSDIYVKYVAERTITFTTAGASDAEYPYTGRAARATVVRGSGINTANPLMTVKGNLNFTNIIIDGGAENGVTPGSGTRCVSIDNAGCKVGLEEGAILQNGKTNGNTDGGGVYVNNGKLTVNGGIIRSCSARNGGGVYVNAADGLELVAGAIMQCRASGQGGGVFVQKGPFTMSGGTISSCEANAGGGVLVADGQVLNMSGGLIVGNRAAAKGGGIAVGSNNSKIFFSRKVTVSGNTSDASKATGKACNVELDRDSNAVINTNNGGLGPGSYIGVYLPDGTTLYDKHGQERQPFGTFADGDRTTNLYSFVNDRNMLKGGLIAEGDPGYTPNTIYWIQIFSLKVTKELEHGAQEEIDEGLRFRFKVTVSGRATVSGQLDAKDIDSSTGDYGEMVFHSDGQFETEAEFYLAPGESITAVNLSEGLDYKVEELLTDTQKRDYAVKPSSLITGKIGENKERTDVDPYTSDLLFTNILPVCKLTSTTGLLLYQRVVVKIGNTEKSYNVPAVYTNLEDAFEAIKAAQLYQGSDVDSSPRYDVQQGVSIELLTDVALNAPQTIDSLETVTLKTASKNAAQFPFRGNAAQAKVTRAYDGPSMLTVNGSLTLESVILDGAKAGFTGNTNGGAVCVNSGATLAVSDSVIRNNRISGAAINGAGIYVADGANLKLSGQLDFGGKGTKADGTIIEGSGNYKADEELTGATNGGMLYTVPRQDIYLAEANENDPRSIRITGDLSGTDGSIWVWAASEYHYKQNMPFARLDDGVSGGNLRIFRDARDDSTAENGTDTWLYGTPEGDTEGYVYWSGVKGSRRVILRKVNGSLTSLQGAEFAVYKGSPGGTPYFTIAGNDNALGILWVGDLPYGTYYLEETKAPEGHSAGWWYSLVVGDPAGMIEDPQILGPFASSAEAVRATSGS